MGFSDPVHELTPTQVKEALDKGDIVLIDVREPYEWEAGRIEGAVHVPLARILTGATEGLDPSKPVVAVCKMGNRSEVASLMLQAGGFDAYNMRGGMEAWEAEGLPFTTPAGEPGRVA